MLVYIFLSYFVFSLETKTELNKNPTGNEVFKSKSTGHLLTSNNQTLEQGKISLGTMYAGIGLSDNFVLAMSPFVFAAFNMNNIMARYAVPISRNERVGIDIAYFKTFGEKNIEDANSEFETSEDYDTNFKMEAVSTKLSYSFVSSSQYRFSTTLSYFYYMDDDRPFSFRMDPQNDDKYAINMTSLHELKIKEKVYLNLEGGMWGLNYKYPYFHLGATINFNVKSWFVGFGASSTFSPAFPSEKAKRFAGYDSRASVHPEIQVQYFF